MPESPQTPTSHTQKSQTQPSQNEAMQAAGSAVERLAGVIGLAAAGLATLVLAPDALRSGATIWLRSVVVLTALAAVVNLVWLIRGRRFSSAFGMVFGLVGGLAALVFSLMAGVEPPMRELVWPACLMPLATMMRGLFERSSRTR